MLFLLKNPSNGVVIRNAMDPISDDGDDYGNSSNKNEYILLSPHNKFSIMIIIIIMMMIRRNLTIQSPMEMSEWTLHFLLIFMLPLSVIADFTTPGESHLYGLPLSLCRLFGPMDLFYTFDVSKIIPKNMLKFLYTTFKPFLAYICGFDP